jgi:hypothetical protein
VDTRRRFAVGGAATVVASIAVMAAVAVTTSAVLADAAGSPVGAAPLLVPSASPTPVPPAAAPANRPAAASSDATAVGAGAEPAPPAPVARAEVVPAPEPGIVPDAAPFDLEVAEASVSAWRDDGAPDLLRDWALSRGWSADRVDRWFAGLADDGGASEPDMPEGGRLTDADLVEPGAVDSEGPGSRSGSGAERGPADEKLSTESSTQGGSPAPARENAASGPAQRSPVAEERAANTRVHAATPPQTPVPSTGRSADNPGLALGTGAKKAQSRVPPDQRD